MLSKTAKKQIYWSVAILIACCVLFFVLTSVDDTPKTVDKRLNIPVVHVRGMKKESVTVVISSHGVIRATTQTVLVSEVSGVVKEVADCFEKGVVCESGDVLVRINGDDYQLAIYNSEADLVSRQARFSEEEARYNAEKRNWVASGRDINKAPALLLRKPFLEEEKAAVIAAKARFEQSKRDFEKTLINMPYTGMIAERDVRVGQFVKKGDKLGEMFATKSLEVRVPIKPSELILSNLLTHDIKKNKKITAGVFYKIGKDKFKRTGIVSYVEGILDSASRMYYAVIKIDNPYQIKNGVFPLTLGTFVEVEILGITLDGMFKLPSSAFISNDIIMVIDEKDNLWFRKVSVVYKKDSDVFISEGLSEKDKVLQL